MAETAAGETAAITAGQPARAGNRYGLGAMLALALSSGGVQALAALSNLFTIKIVAPLGESALSAVTTGHRLFFVVQALLMGLNVGAIALISRSWGGGDRAGAGAWLRLTMQVSALLSLLLALVFWFAAPTLLAALGLDAPARAQGLDFVRALAPFYLPIAVYLTLAAGLRACGDARTPLLSGFALNLLTVLLTYLLARGALGLPGWGVAGVAVAAGIANLLGLLAIFSLLLSGRLRLSLRAAGPAPGDALTLWRLGYPAALEQGVRQLSVLAFLWVVAHYGSAPYAAYGAGVTLLALSLVIGYGFSVATAVLVGQSLGAGETARAKGVLRAGLITAVGSMSALGLLLGLFAGELAGWLVGAGAVADHTTTFIHLFAWAQPLIAADFVLAGALQGSGDTRWPLYSSLLGPLLVRFGLAALLLHWQAPIEWIYATMLVDYVAKVGLLAWRVGSGRWLLRRAM